MRTATRLLLREMAHSRRDASSTNRRSFYDHSFFYSCKNDQLAAYLREYFVQLEYDEETDEYCKHSESRRSIGRLMLTKLLKTSGFMSHTEVNAYTDHGHMFVVSKNHLRSLFGPAELPLEGDLLDIGAGNGNVTTVVKSTCVSGEAFVTEASYGMIQRLAERGFNIIENWKNLGNDYNERFQMVSVLNVLDRCSRPLTLLKDVYSVLKPGGYLLIALVYPFNPWVEVYKYSQRQWVRPDPEENLMEALGYARSWEEYVEAVVEILIRPCGFAVVRFGRVPYLSECGDIILWNADQKVVVSLDCLVILCKKS